MMIPLIFELNVFYILCSDMHFRYSYLFIKDKDKKLKTLE